MLPREFLRYMIVTYEGNSKIGYMSRDSEDAGNWVFLKGGQKRLVGSNFGVTGAVLAAHRKVPVDTMTMAIMVKLTLDEAVDIAFTTYFDAPDFDLLPWNPVTASIVDMGWGAGTGMASKLVQRLVLVADDGDIGQKTAAAVQDFYVAHGLEESARLWAERRNAHYEAVIRARPTNAKYRDGWRRRTAGFLPNTAWWAAWGLPKSNR